MKDFFLFLSFAVTAIGYLLVIACWRAVQIYVEYKRVSITLELLEGIRTTCLVVNQRSSLIHLPVNQSHKTARQESKSMKWMLFIFCVFFSFGFPFGVGRIFSIHHTYSLRICFLLYWQIYLIKNNKTTLGNFVSRNIHLSLEHYDEERRKNYDEESDSQYVTFFRFFVTI